MPTEKRQRQKEGRAARLEAAYAQQRRAKARRRMFTVAGVIVAFLGVAFVISLLAGDDDDSDVATGDTSPTTATTAAPSETECPPADGSAEKTQQFSGPPPMCIDLAKTYTAKVTTTKGEFTVELLDDKAPETVNNFVVLSRYHYYDDVVFHRIIPGFVVQGGDPEGTGSGGPGYEFDDELPEAGEYELGSLAMANSGPGTNGSQFFVITGEQGVQLPPQYSLFGKVTEGMDVVMDIEAVGSESGTPSEEVTIESIEITES